MLTGRRNYRKFGLEKNPEALLETQYNWGACLAFWQVNKFDDLITGDDEADIKKVTRKLNGGYIGLDHRRALFFKLKSIV